MATGNRHKVSIKPIKIPSQTDPENRGYLTCRDPFLVLASVTEGDRYHNDISGFAQKLFSEDDTADWVLEFDGQDVAPLGVAVTFPNEEFVSAFVVDWRQHLADTGAGCYKVRCDWNIGGVTGSFYRGSYNLIPWTIENASGTVRILSTYNDFSRALQIDFTDSGFNDTLRFYGQFGKMQPNMEVNNFTDVDFVQRKVKNDNMKSFILEMYPTTDCYTTRLIDEHLLHANDIWISDHNATNHSWNYRDLPVILKMETTPELNYPDGSRLASVTATFEEKVVVQTTQFAGGLTSGVNASYILTGSAGGIGNVTIHNTDNSYTTSATSGSDVELPDITITTGSGNVTSPSVIDVDLSDYFQIILPTGPRTPVNTVSDPNTEIAWIGSINTTTGSGTVEKTGGGAAWNADANFVIPTLGDFRLSFTVTGFAMVGFSVYDINASFDTIGFAIYRYSGGYIIYESGAVQFSTLDATSYTMRIDFVDEEVRYYINNALVRTSTVPVAPFTHGYLTFDCSILNVGDKIENILLTFL